MRSWTTLALSILAHALLVLGLPLRFALDPAAPPPEEPRQEIAFRLVDASPAPEEEPEEPTPLVSTRSSRAAQPEAPPELPEGAAYREGATTLPMPPRAATPPARSEPAARPSPSRPSSADPEAPDRSAPDPVEGEPAPSVGDERLRIPQGPIDFRTGRSSPAVEPRLPSPETDQRLTRAGAGAAFSLNTTAWDYAPYLERLKRRIEERILFPAAFYYGIGWATRVRFRIAPDGRLTSVELLDHAGVRNLSDVAVGAIRRGAEYEPLPADFPEPYLEVTGSFYFNVTPAPADRR